MSGIKSGKFNASDLRKVTDAPLSDFPPLTVGDLCCVISGSPNLLVVDADDENLIVAFRTTSCEDENISTVNEFQIPRCCVRRAR
ncbi:MAG TPA: hypothetical protein VII92_08335 [Anaerolineae bacterium]